jgi:alpha-beta hydrolase superfamily lysophospholipase
MQELQAPVDEQTTLFYRAWTRENAKKAVVLVHRGHEHSGRLVDVVENLGITNASFFAWDARGHGKSPSDRGYAPSFSQIVKDLDAFVRHVSQTHGIAIEDMVVLGHSVGAVTVATWVHDFAPRIRAMVLVTPALKVKLYVPFARTGLKLLQAMRGDRKSYVQSYVKSTMLTHDPAQTKRYAEDPLITRAIALNVLLDLYEISERIVADAGAIRVPALVLSGGADWVVDVKEQRKFFERLGSTKKKMRVFDRMYHDLHEAGRADVLAEIRDFINESHDEREPPCTRIARATRSASTTRYATGERGSAPRLPRNASRRHHRQHRGIRLMGERFRLRPPLDYVYENEARGGLGVGKPIDRAYLNSPGWRASASASSISKTSARDRGDAGRRASDVAPAADATSSTCSKTCRTRPRCCATSRRRTWSRGGRSRARWVSRIG